ncbi:hypothetical protein AB0K80_22015 [Streptomyces sp. NPDC052682]|uniref:hypothetical protein n=1 Tax=Streptomyces sp. NPDC052682 TaxID=3154954 RepID=UPI003425B5D9
MTRDDHLKPLSVYRLLPSLGDFRTLLMGPSLRKIIRWQISGSPADLPTALTAEWDGNPQLRATEFPSGYPEAPVLSRRIADAMREELLAAGRLIPVHIEGADAGAYLCYAVEAVVDCVDVARSSRPKRTTGEIKKTVFRADALPADLPAFRVPQFPGGVYWNGWAVDRLWDFLGADLEARLVWSEDAARTPHPNPWGLA